MSIVKEKRGVSEIVSYVLLISITFIISGMVYAWLVFYVTPGEEIKCDDGVSLTISDYHYNCSTKELNITLQNRGLFDVDGYTIRVNNRSDSRMGVYTLNSTGLNISTNGLVKIYFPNSSELEKEKSFTSVIKFMEVQPYVRNGNSKINCEHIAKQNIECS